MTTQLDAPLGAASAQRLAARAEIAQHSLAILRGGRSSEREVSLWTGAAVSRGVRSAALLGEPPAPRAVHEVEIEVDGRWTFEGSSASAGEIVARLGADCVWFLALHGGAGEDGTIQGLLEAHGVVHTGSGVRASAICMDKHVTRLVLADAGLRVAPGLVVDAFAWRERRAALEREFETLAHAGACVKPVHGGSSVATFLLDGPRGLAESVERVLATGDQALVEARVRGSEATCGVVGLPQGELRALTPVEIVPKEGLFFDYQQKYDAQGAAEFCPPRTLDSATCALVQELALAAFRAAGCEGYARIDFMIPRDERGTCGEPVVLEINTLPGLTDRSLLPQSARVDGLSFRGLCLEIVALALERRAREARGRA